MGMESLLIMLCFLLYQFNFFFNSSSLQECYLKMCYYIQVWRGGGLGVYKGVCKESWRGKKS